MPNDCAIFWETFIIHYSKKIKEHDQHHLCYVDTLRSSC